MIKGKFIDNLPKVYGIYTGGLAGPMIWGCAQGAYPLSLEAPAGLPVTRPPYGPG